MRPIVPHGSLGPDAQKLEEVLRTARHETSRPHGRRQRFEDSFSAAELLPALERAPRLSLGAVIGQGGMGTVHLARQASLDRSVAVKTLRTDAEGSGTLESFLQEARVTGLVEHPNVVPVYDLVVTDSGAPALVMKRVVGVPWPKILAHPALIPEDEASDPIAFNLRILMAICDAVQYAHETGIVHRDIKPDNVMVGHLGEVYLLDWGLAVSMREDHAGFIALAREAQDLVGTPAYMAPEMVGPDAPLIGPRTDVYLLGATLHEVVTGEPPHDGKDLYEVIRNAFESRPHQYGARVPDELAAICLKAMAREPKDRFQSASELRAAVESYLTHRESHALTEAGREALAELERRIDEEKTAESPIDDLFGALRFSLGQAIELWPGNEQARAAWQRALGRMAWYEASRGREAAAAALLAERSEPDEELSRTLRRLRRERDRREEEVKKLRTLKREHDPAVSRRIRSRAALVVGIFWFAVGIVSGRLRSAGMMDLSTPVYLGAGVALIAMLLGLMAVRRELLANEANRRIMLVMLGGAFAVIFARIVAAKYQQDVLVTVAREQLMFALQVAIIALISDRRILVGAGALVVTGALATVFSPLALELGGVGVLLGSLWIAFVWREAG